MSRQAALGFWLAGGIALLVGCALFVGAPAIVAALKAPDAELARHTEEYIRVGCRGPG